MRNLQINMGLVLTALFVIGLEACDEYVENRFVEQESNKLPLFSLLDPAETGIYFVNIVIEDEQVNFGNYINVFNGGGVTIGDFNNDGLQDIYLTGSMTANKLYINQGGLKFRDVTNEAGVSGGGGWCTGSTLVDINGDGLLDIYVCRSFSDNNPNMRENLLYINNGNLTFSEQASLYGLNDNRYAIQASFFDYDLDGDLDLYLGNHPRQYLQNLKDRVEKYENPTLENSDKFYKNNGDNTFSDATLEAGLLNYGFMLGINTSDINNDGWPDIYVTNDHAEPDLLYINNQDGTFSNITNNAISHMSNFGMGG